MIPDIRRADRRMLRRDVVSWDAFGPFMVMTQQFLCRFALTGEGREEFHSSWESGYSVGRNSWANVCRDLKCSSLAISDAVFPLTFSMSVRAP